MNATIGSGRGAASDMLARLDLESHIGYVPFPGTLNIRFAIAPSRCRPHLVIEGHQLFPVTINGVEGHLIRWPHDERSVSFEVIAPVHLRSTLGISDRQMVDVQFHD